MKKQLAIVCAALGMVACMQEEVVTVQQNAISFKGAFVDNATRAAEDPSTTLENITNFNVWGFMDQPSGYVFTGDKVEKAGDAWTYANTQYWAPNHTYYFAAVSPADSQAWSLETSGANTYGPGVLTFTNANGIEDLLYAATSVETPQYDDLQAEGMEAVKLQFNHLLSKVKFTFTNGFATPNSSVEIKDIKMTAPEKGTIDLAVENWWDNDDWKVEGTKTLEFGNVALLAAGQKDECTYERLTLPVNKAYEYQVEFTVVLYTGDVEALETTKTTAISGVALEMGKAYNFAAEINPENLHLPSIEFEVVEVKDWVTAETPNVQVQESELKAAALLGGSYTLPGDIVLTSPVVVPAGTHFTVNLNGHNITSATDAFEVAGGNLTINGDGLVYAATENGAPYCAVWAYGDAYVRINGGEYKIGYPDGDYNDLIYAKDNAQIDIYGGYFHNSGQDNAFVLNLKDGSNADITVYGGTFEKFDPADNASENPRQSFVAEGYVARENNAEYVVVKGTKVASVDELKNALENTNHETIYFASAINFDTEALKIRRDVTIDMAGKQFTSGVNQKLYGVNVGNCEVILNNANINGGGINAWNGAKVIFNSGKLYNNNTNTSRYSVWAFGEGTVVTIKSGDFTWSKPNNAVAWVADGAILKIEGGNFATAGNVPKKTFVNLGYQTSNGGQIIITGGKFGFDPSAYVAEGYKATKNGSVWTVSAE